MRWGLGGIFPKSVTPNWQRLNAFWNAFLCRIRPEISIWPERAVQLKGDGKVEDAKGKKLVVVVGEEDFNEGFAIVDVIVDNRFGVDIQAQVL